MTSNELTGHLILLTAPSGSGKKKLIECLDTFRDELYLAKTLTSREPRENAPENPLYTFITREEFERLIEAGEFIEWAEYSSNLYGTPKSEVYDPLKDGKVVFKEMELQGVDIIRRTLPADAVTTIFIDAGPWKDLRERILSRNPMSEEMLEQRRARYEVEVAAKDKADIVIENHNGRLAEAQAAFTNAITGILARVKK